VQRLCSLGANICPFFFILDTFKIRCKLRFFYDIKKLSV